jgi:hypothetical protein
MSLIFLEITRMIKLIDKMTFGYAIHFKTQGF